MATITYNGYTDLTNVKIDSWVTAARFAEDGISIQSHEHRVSGTALISGTTGTGAGSFKLRYAEARAKLTRPRGNLRIDLGAETLYDNTGTDELGGPIVSFRPTQFSALHAVVAFDLTFWVTDKAASGEPQQGDVLSHRWVQEWEFGPDMMMVHRVAGSLRVRTNAAPTTSLSATPIGNAWAVGSSPDAYRGLVVPPLPPGFRRERMRFGEDDSGNELVYTVEDKEFAREIPAPALTGNGSFTFTRQLLGAAFMGHKSFEVELAAPTEVPVKDLLAAAVEVSKRRITYSGTLADMLLEISLREPAVLSENKLIYRVEAQCLAIGAGQSGGDLAPPNFQLLSDLLGGQGGGPGPGGGPALAGYADPGVYGTGGRLARAVRRVLYPASVGSSIPSVPQAQFRHNLLEPFPNVIPTTEYHGPLDIADFTGGPGTIPPGTEINAEQANAWLHVSASDRVYVEDTGMRVLRSQRAAGSDQAVQMFKPRVRIVSEFVGARLNVQVHRPLRAQHPAGAVVIADDFEPTAGRVDANGQRIYSARHVRVLELGHAATYSQGANPGWSTPTPGQPLSFWPGSGGGNEAGHLAMAPDPTTQNQDVEGNIFLVAGAHTYFLGLPEPYVT